jgi:hypothetical protein
MAAITRANNIERTNGAAKIIHWTTDGRNLAWETLVDHTGSNWRVYAAALDWAYAGHVNITYYPNSCNGNGHCVAVNNHDFGQNCRDNAAATHKFVQTSGQAHMTSDTEIVFNQRCADNVGEQYTDGNRQVIVCHEEGHSLGLDEAPNASYRDTCMAATGGNFDKSDASRTGEHHDFVMLDDEIYDHND